MSKKQNYDSLESQIGEMGSVQQEEVTLGKLEHFGKSKEEKLSQIPRRAENWTGAREGDEGSPKAFC